VAIDLKGKDHTKAIPATSKIKTKVPMLQEMVNSVFTAKF